MLLVKTNLAQSKIHGIGLFAAEHIVRGTVIWSFSPGLDTVIDPSEVHALPKLVRNYVLRYAYLNPKSRRYVLHADDARFINHSRCPNLSSVSLAGQSEELDVAARDIGIGEKLTTNYELCDADFERKLSTFTA